MKLWRLRMFLDARIRRRCVFYAEIELASEGTTHVYLSGKRDRREMHRKTFLEMVESIRPGRLVRIAAKG